MGRLEWRLLLPFFVLALGASSCNTPSSTTSPAPALQILSADPNPLCLNTTSFPILYINYEISAGKASDMCMILRVNGTISHASACQPGVPLPGPAIAETIALNVDNHFGGNVPQNIGVSAELKNVLTGAEYGEKTATTVQVRNDCPPASLQ